jgi:hypothetical protein
MTSHSSYSHFCPGTIVRHDLHCHRLSDVAHFHYPLFIHTLQDIHHSLYPLIIILPGMRIYDIAVCRYLPQVTT